MNYNNRSRFGSSMVQPQIQPICIPTGQADYNWTQPGNMDPMLIYAWTPTDAFDLGSACFQGNMGMVYQRSGSSPVWPELSPFRTDTYLHFNCVACTWAYIYLPNGPATWLPLANTPSSGLSFRPTS